MSESTPAAAARDVAEEKFEEGPFRSSDGTALRFRHAPAAGGKTPRGRVLIVHGFAEHSGRYGHLMRALSTRGFDAWALDLRGHGAAEGGRAFVRRFDDYLMDVGALVELAAPDRGDGPPLFAIGHSMGGLIVTRFAEERPSGLRGIVLSSAFIAMKMRVPVWKRGAAQVLSRVAPGFALPTGLDPDLLARDPEVGRRYMADPLVLKAATARWFTEALGAQQMALARAPGMEIAALVMHGAADGIADPEGSRALFGGLGGRDKELKLWDGLRHEPFNEPEGGSVIEYAVSWIEKRAVR